MRYLLLSSFLFLLGCRSVYRDLKPAETDVKYVQKFKPPYKVVLYSAQVDVLKKHLSGLLVIKKMDDGSTRVVFSSELGLKFFDFEFSDSGEFKVHYILEQMNKGPVIKTLQKDFELILMENLNYENAYVLKSDSVLYYTFPRDEGFYYYLTDLKTRQLLSMERASEKKAVVKAVMSNFKDGIPDTIGISHRNFKFNIGLKKIEK